MAMYDEYGEMTGGWGESIVIVTAKTYYSYLHVRTHLFFLPTAKGDPHIFFRCYDEKRCDAKKTVVQQVAH